MRMRDWSRVQPIIGSNVWTNEELDAERISLDWDIGSLGDESACLALLVDRIGQQLKDGPGVALVRSAFKGDSRDAAVRFLLEIGGRLGEPMQQDLEGTVVFEVSDYARVPADLHSGHSRGARNNMGIGLHTE